MLGIELRILIFQILNFAILFFLLKRLVFPNFFRVLEERRKRIEEGIIAEKKAKEKILEIEKLKEKMEIKEKEIIKETVEKIKKEAEKEKAEIILRAKKEKEKLLEEAKKMAELESKKIKEEAKKEIFQTVLEITEKILKEKVDLKRDEKIIKEVINNLKI